MNPDAETVLTTLDALCRIRGYRMNKSGQGEEAIALHIAERLRAYPWLIVSVDAVCDEEGTMIPGFFNVFACDGNPADVQFLVVGHIDTVTPTQGWAVEEFSVREGRYHALGAADARGGIAACLDAIGKAGPTRGVGYLFYGDEEVNFVGMQDFVRRHADVKPAFGLSVCGGKAEAYLGWRGCLEIEFLVKGVSGHASRQKTGANAAEAMVFVLDAVRTACLKQPTRMETAVNLAAIHVGSFDAVTFDVISLGTRDVPAMKNIANKIPNVGWALMDVRSGDQHVNAAFFVSVAQEAMAAWNRDRTVQAELTTHVNFEMPAYEADREATKWLFDVFEPVHRGRVKDPASTGFIDVTLLSDAHKTQFMCLAPAGGNEHGADEYVDVVGLSSYRDCLVTLLKRSSIDKIASS